MKHFLGDGIFLPGFRLDRGESKFFPQNPAQGIFQSVLPDVFQNRPRDKGIALSFRY